MANGKIRLLLIIDCIRGIRGGTETQLKMLINNLNKERYDINMLCLRKTPWIMEKSSTLHCKIEALDFNNLVSRSGIRSLYNLIKFIKVKDPDIVMTFFPESNIIGVLGARMAGIKVVFSTRRDYGLWLKKNSYYLLRFANMFVKGIIVNSENVKKLVAEKERFDGSKVHVIYNGIKVGSELDYSSTAGLKEELGISSKAEVVGIVGNLRPMKRHKTFIRAARIVLDERPDVHFVIVGDGQLRGNLEGLCDKLGIRDQIHFVGSQEDVLPFVALFDIGVNCSANEGLSNAIMEYMIYGVASIVARAGGNEELIENEINGYTFELDSEMELGGLILDLLDDQRKRKKFGERSQEIIRSKLSVEKMVCGYDRFFENIVERNK